MVVSRTVLNLKYQISWFFLFLTVFFWRKPKTVFLWEAVFELKTRFGGPCSQHGRHG
jgi:hypothetical protein